MESYLRFNRPAAGQRGRVILEVDTPERGGVPTIFFDDGQQWVSTAGSSSGGGVSSVGLALPTDVFDVSGSPVTGSGTLTGTFDTQAASSFFAGPTSGSTPAAPTFRPLDADDMPPIAASVGFRASRWAIPMLGSATPLAMGLNIGSQNLVAVAAATSTNRLTQQIRANSETTSALNQVAWIRGTGAPDLLLWRGDAAGLGGFQLRQIFGLETVQTTQKWFVGVRASTVMPGAAVEPSAGLSCVYVGCDSTDTNIQLMHNDGAGTCTKTDYGSGFDARTAGSIFVLDTSCAPNSSDMTVTLRKIDGSTVTTVINSNLPAASSFMTHANWINNGTSGTPGIVRLSWLYTGTDFPEYLV